MATVIITGANGSIAIRAIEYLLKNHAGLTLLLTVRDPSPTDANTQSLRDLTTRYPQAKASIHKLDLSSLASVESFSGSVAKGIADGIYPPISSIICNAYYWNLIGHVNVSEDGYEKTFQVNHVSHAALVLRLLGHFGADGGRVLLFSSDAHLPGKNMLEKIPPEIPHDLEELVKPVQEAEADPARGFQRYANSKLAITSWTHALNRHILASSKLRNITAVAMNPGNISDSRALRTNTPQSLALMQRFLIQPLMPVIRTLADPTMRTAETAGIDVAKLALGEAHPGERGYFTLLENDTSSPESLDEGKQERLWEKTMEWAKVGKDDTSLSV